MENLKSNNSGKLIAALLLGTAVGAGLGILFAPDKGSETRKKLFNGAADLANNLKENVKESVNNLRDKAKETREYAEN